MQNKAQFAAQRCNFKKFYKTKQMSTFYMNVDKPSRKRKNKNLLLLNFFLAILSIVTIFRDNLANVM